MKWVGFKVDVVYDPSDITELTIEYEGYKSWTASQLVIDEHGGKRLAMPQHLDKQPTDRSRFLDAAEDQHESRQIQRRPAVSYRNVRKEDSLHV